MKLLYKSLIKAQRNIPKLRRTNFTTSQKQTTNTGTVDSVVTNQNAKNKIEVVAVDVIENTADKIISVDEQIEPFHAVSNGNNGLSNCEITI